MWFGFGGDFFREVVNQTFIRVYPNVMRLVPGKN